MEGSGHVGRRDVRAWEELAVRCGREDKMKKGKHRKGYFGGTKPSLAILDAFPELSNFVKILGASQMHSKLFEFFEIQRQKEQDRDTRVNLPLEENQHILSGLSDLCVGRLGMARNHTLQGHAGSKCRRFSIAVDLNAKVDDQLLLPKCKKVKRTSVPRATRREYKVSASSSPWNMWPISSSALRFPSVIDCSSPKIEEKLADPA